MSTPNNNDLIVVERSNVRYKATKVQWDAGTSGDIDYNDLLLVERGNTVYKQTYGGKSNIDASDLLLVERTNVVYKCTNTDFNAAPWTGTGKDIYADNYAPPITIYQQNLSEGSGDTNRDYDILNLQVHPGATSRIGHLYLGLKVTATTTYYGDTCIGAVQILNSAQNTVRYTYHMGDYRTINEFPDRKTSKATGYNSSWGNPDSGSYTNPSWGASAGYWTQNYGTGSSYTGANNGISYVYSSYGSSGSMLPYSGPGTTVSQYSGNNFMYVETSGSSTNWLSWMRMGVGTGTITLYDGDYIRIAYLAATHSSGGTVSTEAYGTVNPNTGHLWLRFH